MTEYTVTYTSSTWDSYVIDMKLSLSITIKKNETPVKFFYAAKIKNHWLR